MTFDKSTGKLTLDEVSPVTVAFPDWPEHVAANMKTTDFVPFWSRSLGDRSLCVPEWFQGRHLAQPAQMSVGLTEFGGQKGLDQVPSHRWSDCPTTHANNVHVIILDPLPRREVIVDQRRAHAGNLVGTYRCPHTAAADRHATFDQTHHHPPAERGDKIRIVVVRLSIFAPKSITSCPAARSWATNSSF